MELYIIIDQNKEVRCHSGGFLLLFAELVAIIVV